MLYRILIIIYETDFKCLLEIMILIIIYETDSKYLLEMLTRNYDIKN
jgi:hypothetical protein